VTLVALYVSVITSCVTVVEVCTCLLGGSSGVINKFIYFHTDFVVSRTTGGTYIGPSIGTYVGICVPRGT
jgi:hypothetical protein